MVDIRALDKYIQPEKLIPLRTINVQSYVHLSAKETKAMQDGVLEHESIVTDTKGALALWERMVSSWAGIGIPPSLDLAITKLGFWFCIDGQWAIIPKDFIIDPLLYHPEGKMDQMEAAAYVCELLLDVIQRPAILQEKSANVPRMHGTRNVRVAKDGTVYWKP